MLPADGSCCILGKDNKSMDAFGVQECECSACRGSGDHPDKAVHRRIHLLVSRLDENQRRWFMAAEAMRIGHGGDQLLSQVTGMNVETIRRRRRAGMCASFSSASLAPAP
jgi:hypothetical protein